MAINLPEEEIALGDDAEKLLRNTTEIIPKILETWKTREKTMGVIVAAAFENENATIRTAAFECLLSISVAYHNLLKDYMQCILENTKTAVENDKAVALQAVGFWSSLCELDISDQIDPRLSRILGGVHDLVPVLLQQDKNNDLAMAGGKCLHHFARMSGDYIVNHVMPFVVQNMEKSDWPYLEAALHAFGAILQGASSKKLSSHVPKVLKKLCIKMSHENINVQCTCLWTLSRTFEFHFLKVPIYLVEDIVPLLVANLNTDPRVSEKVFEVIYFLALGYEKAESSRYLKLTQLMDTIVTGVITIFITDGIPSKLRSSAYKSLIEVVRCSQLKEQSLDIIGKHLQSLVTAANELEDRLADKREEQGDLYASFYGVIQAIIKKLSSRPPASTVSAVRKDIMNHFRKICELGPLSVKPLIISCIDYVAIAIREDFEDDIAVVMGKLTEFTPEDRNGRAQIDYEKQLQQSVLEAYSGIAQGCSKQKEIDGYVDNFLKYVTSVARTNEANREKNVTEAAMSALGHTAERVKEMESLSQGNKDTFWNLFNGHKQLYPEELKEVARVSESALLCAFKGYQKSRKVTS